MDPSGMIVSSVPQVVPDDCRDCGTGYCQADISSARSGPDGQGGRAEAAETNRGGAVLCRTGTLPDWTGAHYWFRVLRR